MARSGRLAGPPIRAGIVLALRGHEQPTECLERALELASRRREPLHLLRIHAPPGAIRRALHGLFGGSSPMPGLRQSYARTRQWLESGAGRSSQTVRVTVSVGDFLERAASCTRHARAGLLIVSPNLPDAGGAATALAHRSGAHVLIARDGSRPAPILAATDLQDPTFPVLSSAAAVARLLERPLVAFHNVDPLSLMSGQAAVATGVMLDGASAATRRESLVSVSRALDVDPRPVLRKELDPVHAILDEAEACDASLIVVGSHHAPWWSRWMNDSVSARVAGQADRAVLVAPIRRRRAS